MATRQPQRVEVLPSKGRLLVSTDLHGNLEDFRALRDRFLASLAEEPETHWALLGDFVHGPNERVREEEPELYDYDDASGPLVRECLELKRAHPERVHVVLGNHDYGQIGGPHTHKFFPDEVEHLEQQATAAEREAMEALFRPAMLVLLAPCGVMMSHGSPDDQLRSLFDLDGMPLPPERNDERHQALRQILCSYGQQSEVTARLLERASTDAGFPLTMVVHGHDRDVSGWFVEGGNQAQPVIFGALRANKRYLRLDLAAHYAGPDVLRDGVEILRLYG